MDTRIGYPNEHLASDSEEKLSSPMYATAVGLVIKGLQEKAKHPEPEIEEVEEKQEVVVEETIEKEEEVVEEKIVKKEKKNSFFDRFISNLREFLDNAE